MLVGIVAVCFSLRNKGAGALRNRGCVGGGARAGAAPACDAAAQGEGRRRGLEDGRKGEPTSRQRHLGVDSPVKAPTIRTESSNSHRRLTKFAAFPNINLETSKLDPTLTQVNYARTAPNNFTAMAGSPAAGLGPG